MNVEYYLSSKLAPISNFFLSLNRKRVGKNVYQASKNIKLFLRKNSTDMYILDEVFKRHEYDPFGNSIKQNSSIVDIGAHIGIFTCYAADKATKGKIYSFEPYVENFKLLKKNIGLNDFKNVKIFNLAVSSKSEKLKLNISKSNTGGHSFFPNDSIASLTVQSITLSKLIETNKISKIDFLKIDVEGKEYDIIINTSSRVFSLIDNLIIEYHDYLSTKHKHIEIVNCLTKYGFEVSLKQDIYQKLIGSGLIIGKK